MISRTSHFSACDGGQPTTTIDFVFVVCFRRLPPRGWIPHSECDNLILANFPGLGLRTKIVYCIRDPAMSSKLVYTRRERYIQFISTHFHCFRWFACTSTVMNQYKNSKGAAKTKTAKENSTRVATIAYVKGVDYAT